MSSLQLSVPAMKPPARVVQIAEALSKPVREVQESLRGMGVAVGGARSFVEWDDAQVLLNEAQPLVSRETCQDLVIQAFSAARQSGKEGWEEMTVAVLKNRLLALTEGGFRETEYGQPNMAYIALSLPDVVQATYDSDGNMRVRISEELIPELPDLVSSDKDVDPHFRLRDDIWVSFFDFRNKKTYVWDTRNNTAGPGEPDENHLLIPSVTAEEEAGWRERFCEDVYPGLSPAEADDVGGWRENRLGTIGLPPALRGRWNLFLRNAILDKVSAFLAKNSINLSLESLAQGQILHRSKESAPGLRNFVQRCISVMTDEELEDLRFSPAVLLRVQDKK